MEQRITRDCEVAVERLADRADKARVLGHTESADRFLLMAWAAYDDPDLALEQDEPDVSNDPVLKLRKA